MIDARHIRGQVTSRRDVGSELWIVRVRPEGKFTPKLYEVPVGGEVYLRRAAKGRFLFDEKSGHPNHFMVATVTGIAPFLSMLREFVARAREGERISHRIVVLQGASLSSEL